MKSIVKKLNVALFTVLLAFSSNVFAEVINVNTADAQSIATSLNGVGLKKAEAIVAWRKQNGHFTDLASLVQVKGIGQKTVEKNKEQIKF